MPSDAQVFDAMADATRRRIMVLLGDGERTATQIAEAMNHVGRSAVSNHLRILRTSGLINERRAGRFRYYSVNGDAAEDVVGFVASVYRANFKDLIAAVEVPRSASANGATGSRKTG
jgi:ArsR family transcriptional regulator